MQLEQQLPSRKSSASVAPAMGKDINPGETFPPKLFRTARKEPCRLAATVLSISAMLERASLQGTTHWNWKNPRRPYRRFQLRTASNGLSQFS
jgi:hypothetical protein